MTRQPHRLSQRDGVASTAAMPVVNGTDSASAMPPTAERAISMATLSLVNTS
jgi:hypothetical protein